jgi:hypothetical protein
MSVAGSPSLLVIRAVLAFLALFGDGVARCTW